VAENTHFVFLGFLQETECKGPVASISSISYGAEIVYATILHFAWPLKL